MEDRTERKAKIMFSLFKCFCFLMIATPVALLTGFQNLENPIPVGILIVVVVAVLFFALSECWDRGYSSRTLNEENQ